MEWSGATGWWIVTALLVVAELATGTFFLLMLGVGAVAGAVAAHLSLGLIGQMVTAAAVGGGAVFLWYLRWRRRPRALHVQEDRNVHLDIGAVVQVERWDEDGGTRVTYRGSLWHAQLLDEGERRPGPHVIRRIDGSRLLLGRQDT